MEIKVHQGEREMASVNKLLGIVFSLDWYSTCTLRVRKKKKRKSRF
jgi:hypothetical protein